MSSDPQSYLARWLFLRFLGAIYLIAFLSFWIQVEGLIGSNGILPAAELMQRAHERIPWRFDLLPTLAWFNASDRFLHFLCGGGVFFSLLLIAGFLQPVVLFLLWLFYLSLVTVSGEFLSFQWDNLLLETGFLAIFFAPFQLLPRFSRESPPSRIVLWLLWWLLFRLMFESGWVKLLSGDPTWRNLTALTYHYETQPLPTWIGWYVHQLPEWFQKFSCTLMFAIELIAPFFIFGTRRFRLAAFGILVGFQLLIAATGNYTFFNLLTIVLCLLLLEEPSPSAGGSSVRKVMVAAVAGLILFVTGFQLLGMFLGRRNLPQPIRKALGVIAPFRSINNYGLFAVMTAKRPEILIEGSADGETWKAYGFKYKPGDVDKHPGFVAPHQPRLDWQMWFAALGRCEHNPWFLNFMRRLQEGKPEVLKLLASNPFPDHPPAHLRAVLYEYHFTTLDMKRADGSWWWRSELGLYCPVLSSKSRAPYEKSH
jgi:hypothetical protein